METHTDRRKLVSIALSARGVELDAVVAELRAQGRGWRAVSAHLHDTYGVDVPIATLWRWYGQVAA